jgi:hypothetical protein
MNTFGRITKHDCLDGTTDGGSGGETPGGGDPRCQDPAFALANPDICGSSITPHLVIKPGTAISCALGSIQFKAFLVTNGVEQDVSTDSVWATSDAAIALVGAGSGNATGIAGGEATISAVYGDYSATALMTVFAETDCCSSRQVAMMLLVDNSRSMTQYFSADYATRLDYAKAAAVRFANEVNETKDLVGLLSFNEALVTPIDSPTADKDTVAADVATIGPTQETTAFYDALVSAIADLDASTADFKVLILLSDGEDTSEAAKNGYIGSNSPVTLLQNFKDNGGVVMCLGCRASGSGFARLSLFSTGGFFVNGYAATAADALDYLSGLKGYVCAGNCTPAGDVIQGEGHLNYNYNYSFINWDVEDGFVDLIGNGFFDFLPGNGLYVDLAGSSGPTVPNGRMVSKTPFSLVAGESYRLSVTLAGNQREAGTPYSAKVQVFYLTGTTETAILSQVIVINDHAQDFKNYPFTFTAPANMDVYIAIEQWDIPEDNNQNFGLLLGRVQFDNVDTLVSLLDDDFDDENQVYTPPGCGTATLYVSGGYAIGYDCYGEGCLDTPPSAQSPDPAPLPDIESGYTPPQVYTSTKQACASCHSDAQNQDPDAFYDIAFDAHAIPQQADLTTAAIANRYQLSGDAASVGPLMSNVRYSVVIQGSNNGSTWTTLDTYANQLVVGGTGQSAGTVDRYFTNTTSYLHYRITTTPVLPNDFEVVLFRLFSVGTTQTVCRSATATGASQAEADINAYNAALALAEAALDCRTVYTATESVTIKCPTGTCGPDVTKSATATSFDSQLDAEQKARADATILAQAAIDADCAQSTNGGVITLPQEAWNQSYYAKATPFPSVKYVTATGVIAKVTVTLNNISYSQSGITFEVFLRSPEGTWVVVWSDRAFPLSESIWNAGLDITFDDDSANTILAAPAVTADGTYQPSNGGLPPALTVPPECPQSGATYKFTLADFIGEERAGGWSLWVVGRMSSVVTIDGWDLTIT